MRIVRILGACALLGTVAALPSVPRTHAASETTFTSKVCPYSIKYPSGWKVTNGKSSTVGDDFDGGPIVVSILCLKNSTNLSLAQVVRGEKRSLQKSTTVTLATTKGAIGRIDYNKGGAYGIIGLTLASGYIFHMQYVAQSHSTFTHYQNAYFHMLDTIKFK